MVETDASDWVSAGVLLQYGEERILHPKDFYSKEHPPKQTNLEINDIEPMTTIQTFVE